MYGKVAVGEVLTSHPNKIPTAYFSRFITKPISDSDRPFYGDEFPRDRWSQVSHRWIEDGRLDKIQEEKQKQRPVLYGGGRLTLNEIVDMNANIPPEWQRSLTCLF